MSRMSFLNLSPHPLSRECIGLRKCPLSVASLNSLQQADLPTFIGELRLPLLYFDILHPIRAPHHQRLIAGFQANDGARHWNLHAQRALDVERRRSEADARL